MGTGVQDMSGRAIQLQQQAGIAELGPYLLAYRGWKLRVYRAIWNAVRQHWTAERWIRVTDNENVPQFVGINQPAVDEMGQPMVGPDGMPMMQNAIGELDVDIILDEGPDTINAQQDTNETLKAILPAIGPMLDPVTAKATLKLLIDTSALPAEAKKTFRDAQEQAQQPNPQAQMAEQLQMRGAQAEVQETEASAKLKQAQAMKAMADAQAAGAGQDPRAAMMEAANRYTDGQMKLAATQAATRRDEIKGNLDIAGKRLDLMGKQLDIQRQREAPAPQQGAA